MTNWPQDHRTGDLPVPVVDAYAERDTDPPAAGEVLKYQFIAVAPGIAHNYRFLVDDAGRVRFAACTPDPPETSTQVYNTPLPQEPNLDIGAEGVARIRELLDEVDFLADPPYVHDPGVRDGAMRIVTAWHGGRLHEVWLENATNELTDYLDTIRPAGDEQSLDDIYAGLRPPPGAGDSQ